MTQQNMPYPALSYNGTEIRAVSERLNLTDMWKAAGSPSGRGPADWMALTGAKEFVAHVELIAGISGNELVHVVRGGKSPRTEAHWQIGLAYAKYLSPEFHMWCNTVVRERMEGKSASSDALTARETGGVVKAVLNKRIEPLERAVIESGRLISGMEKMMILMGNAMEEQDARINNLMLAANGRVAALEYVSVKELLNEADALQKGRRSLNCRIGRALRDRALLARPPLAVRKCPHSGVWLFPRDFAAVYMAEHGNALVKRHNDRVNGQGILKLVPKKAPKPATEEARP